MTKFVFAVLAALVIAAAFLLSGVAALPAVAILVVLIGGVYLFSHTRMRS